jgi:2-polyprenyl-3-methyl-5-hydroxy-6-metoxy-1,4-benzoquinol methylase
MLLMAQDFYREFENKFRGSRELIKSRLKFYLPFVTPLVEADAKAKTIDLGCGRGEWVELMSEVGFDSKGVDLDASMLAGCEELGLSVEQGDAITCLTALSTASHSVVTAFHVIEHITFAQLQTVVSEAFRVLRPGGVLILETPNPENIIVGTASFYIDPTHNRPIPSQLLSFLVEHHKFSRVTSVRLQESPEVGQNKWPSLMDVLGGASPDYAVIGQKAGAGDAWTALKLPFNASHGLSLATLAERYDAHIQFIADDAERVRADSDKIRLEADQKLSSMEANRQQVERDLQDVLSSRSWRLTAPLRSLKKLISELTS